MAFENVLFIIGAIPALLLFYMIYRERRKYSFKPGIKAGIISFSIIFGVHFVLEILFSILFGKQVDYLDILTFRLPGVFVSGAFWGIVFVRFREMIPGKTSVSKSYFLALFAYIVPIIFGLIVLLSNVNNYGYVELTETYLIPFAQWIVYYLILASHLGFLYDRFRKKRIRKKGMEFAEKEREQAEIKPAKSAKVVDD